MASILDLLNSDIGKSLINGTSQQLGQDKGKTTTALNAALPLILGAMKNSAKTPEGAAGLLSALGNEKHGGGILDNLGPCWVAIAFPPCCSGHLANSGMVVEKISLE